MLGIFQSLIKKKKLLRLHKQCFLDIFKPPVSQFCFSRATSSGGPSPLPGPPSGPRRLLIQIKI